MMNESLSRRERLNLLIRENKARREQERLMDMFHEADLNGDQFVIVPLLESDGLWEAIVAEYERLRTDNHLRTVWPEDLNSSCALLKKIASGRSGPWSFAMESKDIGFLEFPNFPSLSTLQTLCAFDREVLWIAVGGSFFALLELTWDREYDPTTVKCFIETGINVSDYQ